MDGSLFLSQGVALPKYPGRRKAGLSFKPEFTRPDGWEPIQTLPELDGLVFLDLENKDLGLAAGTGSSWYRPDGGFIAGIAVGSDQGDCYVPIGHLEGNIDRQKALSWLREQLRKPSVTVCYHNAPYDLGWLLSQEIAPANLPHDTQAMATLLDEYKLSYALDTLGREVTGRGKADAEFRERCRMGGVKDPMAYMDKVPAWLAEAYALQDIWLTRELFKYYRSRIEIEELQGVYALERECIPLAVEMKAMGVAIDLDRTERTRADFEAKRAGFIEQVYELTGIRVEPNDRDAIVKALTVEQPDIVLPRTTN